MNSGMTIQGLESLVDKFFEQLLSTLPQPVEETMDDGPEWSDFDTTRELTAGLNLSQFNR